MRVALLTLLAIGAHGVGSLRAQSGPASVLTLEEAVRLALRNSPTYLEAEAGQAQRAAALRSAYGAFLPSVGTSFGMSFREGRADLVQGVPFGAGSDVVSSSAAVSVGLTLSAGAFAQLRQSRADLAAGEFQVSTAGLDTRLRVTQQYFTVLQALARAELQDSLVASAERQLALALARQQIGLVGQLDVRNAEVNLGRARASRLAERARATNERLRLFQEIGLADRPEAQLERSFEVSPPTFTLEQLLQEARQRHPGLEAARASESAAQAAVARARAQWLPVLSLSTGVSGYASQNTNADGLILSQQAQTLASRASCYTTDSLRQGAGLAGITSRCDAMVFTDAQARAIRAANSVVPFDLSRSPVTVSAGLSFPLFDRFQREQAIQSAQAQRTIARYRARDQALRLTTNVTIAANTVRTQHEGVLLQEQVRAAADEALRLAEERYRIGSVSIFDVTTVRTQFERESIGLIDARYEYLKALAALEHAMGGRVR